MPTKAEDTPLNRFVTFWWALAVFVSFGVLTVIIAGSRSCRGNETSGYDEHVVAEREAKLTAVLEAQAKGMAGSVVPIEEAMKATVAELAQGKAEATALPVPGTQAAADVMAAMAAQAPAPAEKVAEPIAPVDDPIDEATLAVIMKEGEKAYITCSACHGPDGQGMQIGPQKMAPTMTGSEIVLGEPDRFALAVLKGIFREPTSPYVGIMAPLESAYDDKQLASVMTYVRKSFGNSALTVTPEEVAAAREKFKAVNEPGGIKRGELDQVAGGSSPSNP
jgi:mono/diheme cytochrome c family protein